jgi:hypothetical protein
VTGYQQLKLRQEKKTILGNNVTTYLFVNLFLLPTWCTIPLFCNICITLNTSTCFEKYYCHLQEVKIVFLQHLVSSISVSGRAVHRLKADCGTNTPPPPRTLHLKLRPLPAFTPTAISIVVLATAQRTDWKRCRKITQGSCDYSHTENITFFFPVSPCISIH